MKILIINNSSKSIYQFRYEIIKFLIKKNLKVYLFCEDDGKINELKKLGCEIQLCKFNNSSYNVIYNLYLFFKIFFYIKKNKFHFVFSYGIKSNIYSGIIANFTKFKNINIITGINTQIFLGKNILLITITRILYFLSNLQSNLIFLNKDDLNFYNNQINKIQKKYYMMQSEGVLIDKFLNYKDENIYKKNKEFNFLIACRLIKHKGIQEYLEVAKKFKQNKIKANFLIAGSPYKSKNSINIKIINDLHKNKIINYLGEVDDIRTAINIADCVVLPSYREATGMILVESALMGKPLIASNVPGCNTVVIDNYNGYLVNKSDIDDLYKKCLNMYKISNQKYNFFSKNSIEIGKKFDVKNNIKIYNKIISN